MTADLRSAFADLQKQPETKDPVPDEAKSDPAPTRRGRPPGKRAEAREDTIHIGGYFRPEVDVMLDDLALKLKREGRRVTRQQLLGMALNKLFRAHGFQPIAREKP